MLTLCADSVNELFVSACAAVLYQGRPVTPRGLGTTEVLGAWLCLTQPRRRLLNVPPVRVLNPAFAAAETLWILSGSDDEWIYEFNQRLLAYTDQGRLQGAYGPRLRRWAGNVDQLEQVVTRLRDDPDTRQGVVQLFDPGRDHRGYKDVPCTLGWRFYLRDGRLHLHTTMRSQDLWLGFAYDVFTFTVLQELVAGWLGVEVGEYHHHVDSLHLYDQDVPAARALPTRVSASEEMAPLNLEWQDLDPLLQRIIDGEQDPDPLTPGVPGVELSPGWGQFSAVMDSYRRWKREDRTAARTLLAGRAGVLTGALERWYNRLEPTDSAAAPSAVFSLATGQALSAAVRRRPIP